MTDEPTAADSPLNRLIGDYLQAIEAGQVPDRAQLFVEHPELEADLRKFFADFDGMDNRLVGLRVGSEQVQMPTVRYFGDYELREIIAHGGMGIVYKAFQMPLNRVVALKLVLKGELATAKDVLRFRAEAEAAANLDHPNIVPIYEVGENDGQQYYSMRYVEGTSLSGVPRGTPKEEAERLRTIARAVHYAHQRMILHRDLKPSNILIDGEGTPFVADFGLAKRLSTSDRSLTETGQMVGTPRYMAPEQAMGAKNLTPAADVYSLGVMLYERLTGQTPFSGENVLELLRQLQENEPPRPSSIRPGLDRDLETICLKCLEKEPTRRYPTASELGDDLDRFLRGEPITARAVGSRERFWRWCRRNPKIAALSACLLLAMTMGTVVSVMFAMQSRRNEVRAMESVVRGWVRTLSLDSTNSEPEADALWELATYPGEPLGVKFIEEAIKTELGARQLATRAEPAGIAALGLDEEKRKAIEPIILTALNDERLELRHRAEIGWCGLQLCEEGCEARKRSLEVVLEGWKTEKDVDRLNTWQHRIFDIPHRGYTMISIDSYGGRSTSGFEATARLSDLKEARQLRVYDDEHPIVYMDSANVKQNRFSNNEMMHLLCLAIKRSRDTLLDEPSIFESLATTSNNADPRIAAQLLLDALSEAKTGLQRAKYAWILIGIMDRSSVADRLLIADKASTLLLSDIYSDQLSEYPFKQIHALALVAMRLESTVSAKVLLRLLEKKNKSLHRVIVRCLTRVSDFLEPTERRQCLLLTSNYLQRILDLEQDSNEVRSIGEGIAVLMGHLPSSEARRITQSALKRMLTLLENARTASTKKQVTMGISEIAAHLPLRERQSATASLPQILRSELTNDRDPRSQVELGRALITYLDTLAHSDEKRIANSAVSSLAQTLFADTTFVHVRELWELIIRLTTIDGSSQIRALRVACTERYLLGIAEAHDPNKRDEFLRELRLILQSIGSRDACNVVQKMLAKYSKSSLLPMLTQMLNDSLLGLETTESESIALEVSESLLGFLLKSNDRSEKLLVVETLSAFLTLTTPNELRPRAIAATSLLSLSFNGPLPAIAMLPLAPKPLECRLTTPQLVELLKMPTLHGHARGVVLEQLSNRYSRPFKDHWAFVRYAKEQQLELDFLTPPHRMTFEELTRQDWFPKN